MKRRNLLLLTAAAVPVAAVPAAALTAPRAASASPLQPLTIAVEPLEGGAAAYAPLAPTQAGASAGAKLVIRLALTNTGTVACKPTDIIFSFSNGYEQVMGAVHETLIVRDADGNPIDDGEIAAGATKYWATALLDFGNGNVVENPVYLSLPVPDSVTITVYLDGLFQPTSVTLPLVPYQIAHRPPIWASDLRPGEVLTASGQHWANGWRGTQIYAHDVSVAAWDGTAWNRLLPNTDGTVNEHYRAWGVPIRAVADGTVTGVVTNMTDNPTPGGFPDPTPNPAGGNYVWILHADGTYTYYPHLQLGSVTVTDGQKVYAGDILGKMGASGNASEPHIHLETRRAKANGDAALRPMLFTEAWLLERTAGSPWNPESGLWVPAAGRALPKASMLIWPEASAPAWYPPNKPEMVVHGIPVTEYQTIYNRLVKSGYKPWLVDAHEVDRAVYLNVIFRPLDGIGWIAQHGLTASAYQTLYTNSVNSGYRLINVTSYVYGGTVYYAAIFYKQSGPTVAAYHGYTAAQHQTQVSSLTRAGYHPVNISVAAPSGTPLYTALWVQESVGVFDAPAVLTLAQYQDSWNTNTAAGRQLTYLNGCQVSGEPRITAIFQETAPGTGGTVGRHNRTAASLTTELEKWQKAGYLTRALCGYTSGSTALYGAAWRR